MPKLTLNPAPTFSLKVGIPVAGKEPADVQFTFKHRTKTELDEFIKTRPGQSDTDSVLSMVCAWDLEDEFNVDNVERMLQNYIGAALVIYHAYIDELLKARVKN